MALNDLKITKQEYCLLNPISCGPSGTEVSSTFYSGSYVIPDAPLYTVIENGVSKLVHTVNKALRDYIDNRKK